MFDKTRDFFKETRQELNKVTWPTKSELIGSTIVVITSTFLLALYIGMIDGALSVVIRFLIR